MLKSPQISWPGLEASLAEPVLELLEEVELVLEFRIDLGIGLVAAGGDVDRVDGQRVAAPADASPRRGGSPRSRRRRGSKYRSADLCETMATP